MPSSIKVSFADLTHTGQIIATNTIPLGISYVAAYASEALGEEIDLEVFKYPDDFSRYLETNTPRIACFTAYLWNVRLGHEYARRIKEFSPNTITVFGGPNFPAARDEQQDFLGKYSAIDCYFEFEGEIPFLEFFTTMKTFDFDWEQFKSARTVVPNIRYLVDGELIAGNLAPKVDTLDMLPSPYLSGMCDKFFDDVLIPMLQTTRGCPYSCSFCWEGGDYFQKTKTFSRDRIRQELGYMADRVQHVPDLEITDANFGMFKSDIETAQEIAETRKQHPHGWPKSIACATAKNHKERTIELVDILEGTMTAKASVQSTDNEVLDLIQRKNVSQDAIIALAKAGERNGVSSESEIILCLEGDTKRAHFKTITDMLDAGMTYMRMNQFMLLPGTQSASVQTRARFELDSRFRVLPRCFGTYTLRGEAFSVAEIEEIVVASNTMPYRDYQACRDLDLTVEIFNNDSIFHDLVLFLARYGLSRTDFIIEANSQVVVDDGVLSVLYSEFRKEEQRNLSENMEDLETFTSAPGIIQRYVDGEYGTNELYKYRVLAIFHDLDAVHEVAYAAARSLLKREEHLNDQVEQYLTELCEFSLMRKRGILDTGLTERRTFHFDFPLLMESNFTLDPFEVNRPQGVEVGVYHSKAQRDLIDGYLGQYGRSLVGLGKILIRADFNKMYRSARSLGPFNTPELQEAIRN